MSNLSPQREAIVALATTPLEIPHVDFHPRAIHTISRGDGEDPLDVHYRGTVHGSLPAAGRIAIFTFTPPEQPPADGINSGFSPLETASVGVLIREQLTTADEIDQALKQTADRGVKLRTAKVVELLVALQTNPESPDPVGTLHSTGQSRVYVPFEL